VGSKFLHGDDVAGGVACGAMVGVVLAAGLEVLCMKSSSLNMCRFDPVG
jgi:hypothetical protein